MKQHEVIALLSKHYKTYSIRNAENNKFILDALYANNIDMLLIYDLFECGFELAALNHYSYESESVYHSFDIYYDSIISDYGFLINKNEVNIERLYLSDKYANVINKISSAVCAKEKYERFISNSTSENEELNFQKLINGEVMGIKNNLNEINSIIKVYWQELSLFINDQKFLDNIVKKYKK